EQAITEMLLMEQDHSEEKLGDCWVSQISHLFLRGGNLKNVTVIINEAQNFKRSELKKLLTRLHSNSKCIVEGNDQQIELTNESKSGYKPYCSYFEQYDGVAFDHYTINVRSKFAQFADDFKWK